jgi:hypothetical protein
VAAPTAGRTAARVTAEGSSRSLRAPRTSRRSIGRRAQQGSQQRALAANCAADALGATTGLFDRVIRRDRGDAAESPPFRAPFGLAGGLNLYGFAGGDPVNFSDPFGLCTPMPWCLLVVAGGGAISVAPSVPSVGAIAATGAGALPVVVDWVL